MRTIAGAVNAGARSRESSPHGKAPVRGFCSLAGRPGGGGSLSRSLLLSPPCSAPLGIVRNCLRTSASLLATPEEGVQDQGLSLRGPPQTLKAEAAPARHLLAQSPLCASLSGRDGQRPYVLISRLISYRLAAQPAPRSQRTLLIRTASFSSLHGFDGCSSGRIRLHLSHKLCACHTPCSSSRADVGLVQGEYCSAPWQVTIDVCCGLCPSPAVRICLVLFSR